MYIAVRASKRMASKGEILATVFLPLSAKLDEWFLKMKNSVELLRDAPKGRFVVVDCCRF